MSTGLFCVKLNLNSLGVMDYMEAYWRAGVYSKILVNMIYSLLNFLRGDVNIKAVLQIALPQPSVAVP